MFALVTLMGLINQVSGTPYIPGGDSPAGTDCSGLASWVANTATGRPTFGDRFHTGNEEAALLARGFKYGTAPNALVIGWNGGHTAVTLPDGTPVSSGERGGGVRVGGGGAYQPQFTHHMYLPMDVAAPDAPIDPMAPIDPNAPVDPNAPAIINVADIAPPPPADPAPPLPLDAPPMGDQAAVVAADLATMPPPPADGELPPPPDGPVIVPADNVQVPPPAPAPGDAPVNTPI
ncbi:MAG: peptidoglycan endopeptidase [Mycobacterium sp.]